MKNLIDKIPCVSCGGGRRYIHLMRFRNYCPDCSKEIATLICNSNLTVEEIKKLINPPDPLPH